jgi:hypothetical protein
MRFNTVVGLAGGGLVSVASEDNWLNAATAAVEHLRNQAAE